MDRRKIPPDKILFSYTIAMIDTVEKLVREELKTGSPKKAILKKLATAENRGDVLFFLNTLPSETRKKSCLWINALLALLLFLVTSIMLYKVAWLFMTVSSYGKMSPLLFINLVVPMINFYLLRKILRFERQGFQFLAILSALAFFRPENRAAPEVYFYLSILTLSVFLYLHLFPKKEFLTDSTGK